VRTISWGTSLSVIAFPALARAHAAGLPASGGFAAGLAHPTAGVEHQVCMLAVGLWAAQLSGVSAALVPLGFLLGAASGLALGIHIATGSAAAVLLASTLLVLGLGLLRGRRWPPLGIVAVTAGCGLLHGHAHGSPLSATGEAPSFAAGFLAMTALLHATGFGLALLVPPPSRLALGRVGGALLALAGVVLLASFPH